MTDNMDDILDMSSNYKNTKKQPDYRIMIVKGVLFGPIEEHEIFSMYIDESIIFGNKKELIKGTIEDRFGVGNFTGEITPSKFEFTVNYTKEAVAKGAPVDKIIYKGFMMIDTYIGYFKTVKNNFDESPFDTSKRFGVRKYVRRKVQWNTN